MPWVCPSFSCGFGCWGPGPGGKSRAGGLGESCHKDGQRPQQGPPLPPLGAAVKQRLSVSLGLAPDASQLCLCMATAVLIRALTPRLTSQPGSSPATLALACPAIMGPWLTPVTATRPGPDMTSWFDLGPASSPWPCPMITGLWWTMVTLTGPDSDPGPNHGLALGLPRHHGDRAGAAPGCLAGRAGRWDPALPAPWGAPVAPTTWRKKKYF